MDYFLLLSSSGLAQGALYAMIGMGFALIFKATSVVNFAQGCLHRVFYRRAF